MSFSGILFLLFFLPTTVALYWLVPRRPTAQNLVLLIASYIFFISWGPKAILMFLLATGVNYALLLTLRQRDAEGTPVHGKSVRLIGVLYNIGQLLLLKYLGFFAGTIESLSKIFGGGIDIPALSWILPIGISFWTLQLTAYLVDVSYGRREGPRSLLSFATFTAFFPQLVSGPIPRGDLLDQMEKPRAPSAEQFSRGGFELLLGYVMKFLVAATLTKIVDPVYADPGSYDTFSHWLALLAYAFQIFCDFAGYSLIALGLARFFSLQLIENFRFPFLARNISEFWSRWHISLTNILFEYIYTPLVTGDGFMRGRLAAGLFIVLVVSGLWHGATWMFVLWGALHGAALAIAHRWDEFYRGLCRKDRAWVARRKTRSYLVLGWILTQGWFLLSLIPFRAQELSVALPFLSGLLGSGGELSYRFASLGDALNTSLCLLMVPIYHLSATQRCQAIVRMLFSAPAVLRGVSYGTVIVYLFLFKPLSEGAFVYAQF